MNDDLIAVAVGLALCVTGASASVWLVRRLVRPDTLAEANPAS